MKKKNADQILLSITPYMDRLGLQYAEAVPLDFLSTDVFLELGITAPILTNALKKRANMTCIDNEILRVRQKDFIETVNEFVDKPIGLSENDEDEVKFSLCPVVA